MLKHDLDLLLPGGSSSSALLYYQVKTRLYLFTLSFLEKIVKSLKKRKTFLF